MMNHRNLVDDGGLGMPLDWQGRLALPQSGRKHPSPLYRRHLNRSHLLHAELVNPDGVRHGGRSTARKIETSAGLGSLKKRKPAAERQGESITRWIGSTLVVEIPDPKGGRRERGRSLETDVQGVNRGES